MAFPGQANVSLSARFGIDTFPALVAPVKEHREPSVRRGAGGRVRGGVSFRSDVQCNAATFYNCTGHAYELKRSPIAG